MELRSHKVEMRLGEGGGPLKQEAFRLLSLQGPLPAYSPRKSFFVFNRGSLPTLF